MTTKAAEAFYLAKHQMELEGRKFANFNPNNVPLEELPVIYGFNNGGMPKWWDAVAISEDGKVLGSHCCSDEGYMPNDLGMLEGTRPDRHEESYKKHYPNGYRMEFVASGEIENNEGLKKAFSLCPKEEK